MGHNLGEGDAKSRLRAAYDPAVYRELANRFSASTESFLRRSLDEECYSFAWQSPPSLLEKVEPLLSHSSQEVTSHFSELAEFTLSNARSLHTPTYMGHQVPPPIPAAALFDALGSVPNQANGVYEMGPMSSSAERVLIRRLCSKIGWDPNSSAGIATSGGSLANMTAILTARNVKFPGVWTEGKPKSDTLKIPTIVTGMDSHYSIARAAGVLGIGANNVIKAPVDKDRRVDPLALVELLDALEASNRQVFCLVASSCSTPTGSFDPLVELAEIAEKRGIWLHVDGAHGAPVLFSSKYASLVKGIEWADSVAWDAHKMMYTPALLTFLLYREKPRSFEAFHQEAPYLFGSAAEKVEYDGGLRTFECTKRGMSLSLFGVWALYGETIFADLVDTTFDLARKFHSMLEACEDFEPAHLPQANILCFRYVPKAMEGQDPKSVSALQVATHQRLVERGKFYTTRTVLEGQTYFRVTLMNPFTEERHLVALLDEIRSLA